MNSACRYDGYDRYGGYDGSLEPDTCLLLFLQSAGAKAPAYGGLKKLNKQTNVSRFLGPFVPDVPVVPVVPTEILS
jgi:hypothetical protein